MKGHKNMKHFLFLILTSMSFSSFAHDYGSQLGSDISATDYLYISCDDLTDKVHLEISSGSSASAPIISAQIFKDSKAATIITKGATGANTIDFQRGGGAYMMTISKNATGIVNYALVYHCEDANGNHTETGLDILQEQ
jgi:hypothetical protein